MHFRHSLSLRSRSLLVACAAALGLTMPAGVQAAELNAPIGAFKLVDVHGRQRSSDEFADKQLLVVAFLGTECPLARLYAPRLEELQKEYASRGVAFVAVDANEQDSLTEMGAFAERNEFSFPFLKDREQVVADQFGVERNPHVFLLDKNRNVRYSGRIDDQYGLGASSGYARAEINRRDLATAIDELLAGREVSQPTTKPLGCLIGRQPKTKPHGEITYSKHVAPLLQDRCVRCHRDGEIGPMQLTDFDEVVGWADMIREVVSEERMPPWSASPEHGHFANDARLSEREKQLLYTWVDNGCPQGDPQDLPAPREWTDGWQISAPDQVLKMPKPFTVPAEGVVPYQYISIDPGWKEDKWIQAAEARPGNRAVVHHIIAFVIPPGGIRALRDAAQNADDEESAEDGVGSFRRRAVALRARRGGVSDGGGSLELLGGGGLTAYVPGSVASIYPTGVAAFVPAGSRIVFQMHYTPNGTEQEDQSYVGVVFADPKTVKKQIHGGAAANRRLAIPPGDDNYRVVSQRQMDSDQLLMWMSPHMHLRGKAFRYVAHYPDGRDEILLDVPKYDFNWQLRYELAEPKLLPKGTKLECIAHFDNSEDNLANPDPAETVHWGPQTWNEMMIGFYGTVSVEDDAQMASTTEAHPQ